MTYIVGGLLIIKYVNRQTLIINKHNWKINKKLCEIINWYWHLFKAKKVRLAIDTEY